MDVLGQIRSQYDTLSKTQKKIADYMQQHTNTCCFASLKEIAALTGTTEATVLNFSRKMGYASFLDMRNQLKEGAAKWTTPITTEAFLDIPYEELSNGIRHSRRKISQPYGKKEMKSLSGRQ